MRPSSVRLLISAVPLTGKEETALVRFPYSFFWADAVNTYLRRASLFELEPAGKEAPGEPGKDPQAPLEPKGVSITYRQKRARPRAQQS